MRTITLSVPGTALLLALAMALAPILAACTEAPPDEAAPEPAPEPPRIIDPTTLEYAPGLGLDFDAMEVTPRGVHYRDDQAGAGDEVEVGHTVTVHYTGYFPDGTVFDDSRESDELLTVTLGAGEVIPGLDEGVRGMREGGRRTLVIPPHLAYGAQGAGEGLIPPHQVLVIRVEVLEIL